MDKKELQKNISAYYAKLPKPAQDFFSSMDWTSSIEKIATKYRLNEVDKQTLVIETTLLLLAMIHPVEYEENLTKEISLQGDVLESMCKDIESYILKDIKQILIDTFKKHKEEENASLMSTEVENKLDSRFDTLPKELKDVVLDSNYQNTLYEISKKYQLTIPQMGALDTITTNLIIGEITPKEFKKNIIKTVRLNEEGAENLVNDINSQVFKKIREKLVSITTPNTKKEEILDSLREEDLDGLEVEMQSLKEHGIEIEPDSKTPDPASIPQIKPATKTDLHPMLTQKLSMPVAMPVKKNDYGLNNLPKLVIEKTPNPPVPQQNSYKNGSDPYRTPIE